MSLLQRTENGSTAPYSTSSLPSSLPISSMNMKLNDKLNDNTNSSSGYSSHSLSTYGTSDRKIPTDESITNMSKISANIRELSADDLIHQFRKISEDKVFKDNQILQEKLRAYRGYSKEDEFLPEEKAELQGIEDAVPEVKTETHLDKNNSVCDNEIVINRVESISTDLDDGGSVVKTFEEQLGKEKEEVMSLNTKQLENECADGDVLISFEQRLVKEKKSDLSLKRQKGKERVDGTLAVSFEQELVKEKEKNTTLKQKLENERLDGSIVKSFEQQLVKEKEKNLSLKKELENERVDGSLVKSFEQDLIKEKEKNESLRKQLENERVENESLKTEKETLKGRPKEDGFISSVEIEHQKKIRLLEKKHQDTHVQLDSANEMIEDLNKKIENLHIEKEKLVEKLKGADQSLKDLSNRQIHSFPRSVQFECMSPPGKGTMGFIMNHMSKQLKVSLEQMSNTVQQLSAKEMISRKELIDLKDELHRVTLSLAEEKLKHDQVKRLNAEMEETISVMSENENQKSKICEDLNALRNKHKKCYVNENALKQMKREKKALQKKYESLRRKFEVLNVLHGTLKEELITADVSRQEELGDDFLNNAPSVEIDSDTVDKLRQDLTERDHIIEEYEISERNLKEELELTNKELEETKLINKNLEKNQDTHMKTLNDRIKQMSVCINDMQSEKSRKCEDLEQTNAKYKNDLANFEKHLIERENEIESLREKINQLESTKLDNESKIAMLNEENESLRFSERAQGENDENIESPITEHLKLENDILSSRVLILEGIAGELDIVKKEKDQLRAVNEDLRSQLLNKRRDVKVKPSLSDGDIHKGKVRYTSMKETKSTNSVYESIQELQNDDEEDDLDKNARKLSEMNDNDKQRLQKLLTDPVFEQLLSSNSDLVDLKGFNMDLDYEESSYSETNGENGLTNFNEVLEYVQTIHLPGEDESEVTIQYAKENGDENHEMKESDNQDTSPDVHQEKQESSDGASKSPSKKKRFLGKIRNKKKVKKEKRKGTPEPREPVYAKLNDLVKENHSNSNVKQSASNNKHVQFSEEPKELTKNDTNRGTDAALFKSYYQECLNNEYPALAENNEDDLVSANSSYTNDTVSPLNIVSNEKILIAAKTINQSDDSIQSGSIGTGFNESVSDSVSEATTGHMSCESNDESYKSTSTNESKSDVSDMSGDKDSRGDMNDWYAPSSKQNKSTGMENLERYMRLSMASDHGYGSEKSSCQSSRGSMASASTSSDIPQTISFSAVYSEENAEIEANLRQNKDRFTSKKEFEDFMDKYKQAREEFSEKKKDASDALKVLKTFMSKADDLKEKPTNMEKSLDNSNFLDMVRKMNMKGKTKKEKSKTKRSVPKSEPPGIGVSTGVDDVTSTPIRPKAHRFLPVDLRKQRLSLS